MMRPATRNRAGYSLLEMLVYVALLAVGINLFISALSTGSRLSATTALQIGRLDGVREVKQVFTDLVRRAEAVVPAAAAYTTGPNTVVLRMPPGQPEGFDYVVLGGVRDANRFTLLGLSEVDGQWTSDFMRTLRQPLGMQTFSIDEAGSRPLVTLAIQVKQESGERDRPFLVHELRAAPRGGMGGAQ